MSLCPVVQPAYTTTNVVFDPYRTSHPLTVENFSNMQDGAYWFERLLRLEQSWNSRLTTPRSILATDTAPQTDIHFDILYAGGGLGMIHAAVLQCVHGKNVCVVDRYTAGLTHRDWNISMPELERLMQVGLFSRDEVMSFVQREYKGGFIRFHTPDTQAEPYWLENILDVAVSANGLLALARKKFLDAGGTVYDNAELRRVWNSPKNATAHIHYQNTDLHIGATVMVDCMGAYSPLAAAMNPQRPFTHCCPTVGTISRGFKEGTGEREVNPDIGEILVTLSGADENGRQLIWEGFPGAGDEFITYLFYYDRIDSPFNKSLIDLYEVFFATLHTYKEASPAFDIGRPAFGMIPSYLHRAPWNTRTVALDAIVSLGDAAALSSPLTYCGFGSFVRNLERTTTLLADGVTNGLTSQQYLTRINAYEPQVAISANFAQYLVAKPGESPDEVNATMNTITNVLRKLPPSVGEELFRDTLSFGAYNLLMSSVPVFYPKAYSLLLRNGLSSALWWVLNFLGFAIHDIGRRLFTPLAQRLSTSTIQRIAFRAKARVFMYRDRRIEKRKAGIL
ncbi:MAG: hypothetical protein JNL32_00640 [Candidatus Kapabacteria bacterium]|nr:hypothetical protein [Candidatus Kapabacteria bacterium]